jgi:hypothetical protein
LSAEEQDRADVAFMIDQSHNLKGKVEAMVQTVVTAQELYAKAALIDQAKLDELQPECRLVEAEECFRDSFWQDVRSLVKEWRARGLLAEPLKALAESWYVGEAAWRDRYFDQYGCAVSFVAGWCDQRCAVGVDAGGKCHGELSADGRGGEDLCGAGARLTQAATGLELFRGAAESSTVGNFACSVPRWRVAAMS